MKENFRNELLELMKKAYGFYSKIQVASIIKVKNNTKSFKGVNVENAAYPSGICAERNAIFNSITNGTKPGELEEIHLISNIKKKTLYPCGACLQVMTEFSSKNTKVFIYNINNEKIKEHKLSELIPFTTTKENINE